MVDICAWLFGSQRRIDRPGNQRFVERAQQLQAASSAALVQSGADLTELERRVVCGQLHQLDVPALEVAVGQTDIRIFVSSTFTVHDCTRNFFFFPLPTPL
jgi:hypothetical protein